MPVPHEVLDLINRFERNRAAYKSGQYNETQVRREFIDPFFEALGWDVNNRQGYAEAYKDVIHEDAVKIGSAVKAPDYSFRIGGVRKFFVEAKKPSIYIKEDPAPAFQVRRYAWSAKLPLSIVTDFEEFAVYDCRVKPAVGDKPSTARTIYITCDQYAERWDEIVAIFSRDAILKGSFDKYAESHRAKRGTTEVDSAFLAEIENWRDLLARNIALRNPSLATRELNFAVQRTIDRIIFLRICEDRGIEEYGRLMANLNGPNTYKRLLQLFMHADDRYNSGLFHFQKEKGRPEGHDNLTPYLAIDDKPLKDIIRHLYYPDSPYEFSVLPADILGQVYEQFLGKVIRLTDGHRAVVENKPEVKKAGGVFYTPTYIVEYIVKNTVGKLLEGKTPKQAEKITILDPACGSGSFLLGAYQHLLDWHLHWYAENDAEKWAKAKPPRLYKGFGGEWRLTSAERKRILLNNIYGVDIDSQAVEVTKLSLLLKVLEGETGQTLSTQLKLFHERALPDLGSNIKCGNSLIGPNFYDLQLPLTEEDRYRVNVFDWQAEFPEVFRKFPSSLAGEGRGEGGFDAVIGNPPYGASFSRAELGFLLQRFPQARKFPDSYCLFIEKALELLRSQGLLSFIVPNTFCDLESCDTFREWLLRKSKLEEIWQSGWAFKSAIVDTIVFFIANKKPSPQDRASIQVNGERYYRKIAEFISNELYKIDYRNREEDKRLLDKVGALTGLGTLATVKAGVKMYEVGKGTPPQTKETILQRPFSIEKNCPAGWKPLYRGENIKRYTLSDSNEFVNYGPWLAAPRAPELFLSPKIIMRRTSDKLYSCIEYVAAICVNSCHVIQIKDSTANISYPYLLGLLNSKLLQKIFELQNPQMVGKVFAEIKVIYVERLPIRHINFSDPADKTRHDRMVSLVEQMLALHKRLSAAKTGHDKTVIQRQIDAADRQIDKLVYELYGLTEEEINLIEANRP